MASVDDLKLVLGEALDKKGVTNEIKARLRAEVFSILEDNSFEKPRISQENLLLNELIREYMDFNHYKYSKSVFLKETQQPNEPLNREIIASELHIKEDRLTRQVPLLYSLLWNKLNEDPLEGVEIRNTNKKESKQKNATSSNINVYKYNPDECDPDHKF